MPDPNKADFETSAVLAPQDFSIRQNESQASAQANETFVFDAAAGKVLGDTGETLGFAKKAATYDPAVVKARQDALNQALADQQSMLNDPAKPHVRKWHDEREKLQSLPEALQKAKDTLAADEKFLVKLQADADVAPARLEACKKKVREGPAQIAELEQLTKDAPQTKAALIAQLKTDKDIQALVQQEQKFKAANAVNSSYTNVAGVSSNLYSDDSKMTAANRGGDRQLISRSVASSEVDKLIGTGVIAQEKFVLDDQNKLMGVSIQCDGAGVRSQPGTTNEWGRPQTAFLNIDYSVPAIQKGLCDLEAMDYITGQIDRHPGNIFIEPKSGKVTGIDNDLAFPELDREDMLNRHGGELKAKAVAGMPRVMHTETAAKLMAVSPEDLRTTLKNTQPPDGSSGLGDQEIEGAVARLQNLQAAIRNPDSVPVGFKLVDQFDKQTFAAAVAVHEAQKANPDPYEVAYTTSYLSSILTEEKNVKQQIAKGNTENVLRDARSVGPALRNEQYAEYARQAEIAKQTFKANPQIIPDPADRRQVVDLKQQIAEAKAKIGEYNGRLDKLENPSFGDRLAAVRHGGVDGAREVVAGKKEAAQQRVASLERQLDKAAEKSIPVDLKNGLYQDAGLAVAQRQPQVQSQAVAPRAAAGSPPIAARVPLNELPPPTSKVGAAANGAPPIEARAPLQNLPPPVDVDISKVAKTNISAKTDETGVASQPPEVTPAAPRLPQTAIDQAGPGVPPLAVQNLENEIRKTETALAIIEAQIKDPTKRSSSSNQSPDADNLPDLMKRQEEKQEELKALRTQLAQQTAAPTPALTPASIPVSSSGPLSAPAQDADLSPSLPSRVPPPPPTYPPPPPPDDQDVADLDQSAALPQPSASSIPPGVGFTAADVDDLIQKHVPANQLQGSDVPNYHHIAGKACERTLQSPGEVINKRLASAVEMRLIETNEIEPLQRMLAQEESALGALQATPGIQSDDPRILAQADRVEEMREDMSGWQARVTTLQGSLHLENRQDRLAAINAAQKATNEKVSLQPAKAVSSSAKNVSLGDDVKLNDGNPRQQYELKLAAANTAQELMAKMPSSGIQRGELEAKIKTAYGSAYQYEGPKRYTEEGADQHVKGAHERGINSREIKAIADEMQPMIDQVNEIQQKLGPLEDDYAQIRYDARQGFEKDLSTIPDTGVRGIAQQAQDSIATLTEKIAECDNQISALADPRLSMINDAETLNTAKKEIQDEKKNLMTQRAAAREQLKGALDQVVMTEMQQNGSVQIDQEVTRLKQEQAVLLTAFREQKMNEAAAIKPARIEQTPGYEPTTFRVDKPVPTTPSVAAVDLPFVEEVDVSAPAEKITRLRDVPQELQNDYKDLKQQLGKKDLEPDAKAKIQQRMAELREQTPGLAQLDRGLLARNLHSGMRDGSQAGSSVRDTLLSAGQKAVSNVSDRFQVMNIDRDINKLTDKIKDLNGQLEQMKKDQHHYKTNQTGTLMSANLNGRVGDEAREEVRARVEQQHGDVSGMSKEELFEKDMEITNQGLAAFDDKITALEDRIKKAETKVESLEGQKDAIKNKKDVSLGQGQVVQQKL